MTRWAMVGTGGMADAITDDFHKTENVELAAVVSRTRERAQAYAAAHNIPGAYDDLAPVLEDDAIDGVYVATPHPCHLEAALRALEAGKHVLVEKPMTMSASDSETLIALAQRQRLFCMEAMWMAFNPAIRQVLDTVETGAIGEIRLVMAEFGVAFAFDPAGRLWNKSLGGGTVLDQGVYTLSLAHLLLGAPTHVTAVGTIGDTDIDTEAVMTLDHLNGGRSVLVSSMRTSLSSAARIYGTQGFIDVAAPFWSTQGYTITSPDGTSNGAVEQCHVGREGRGYIPMLRAVSQAISEDRIEHPWWTHAHTLAVARVMDEVLEQIRF